MSEAEIFKFISEYFWQVLIGLGGILTTLFWHLYKKIDNTYSKEETEKLIDLKIIPLIQSLDRHSNLIEKQIISLDRLVDNMQVVHKDLAIVRTQIGYLEKERKKDNV